MHGLVALDADERVLRPAILWNDQRTAASARRSRSGSGSRTLIAATGNRALTGFTAPKLLWLREHEPDVYARIAHILLPKDYVRLRLLRRARDRRRRRLRHAAVRRRAPALERRGAARRWRSTRPGCRARSSRPRSRARRATASRSPPARATRRPARSASGSSRRARRCRSCSAPPASCSARCPRFAADEEARVHAFCHAVPDTWHAMGVMLSRRGLAARGCATRSRAGVEYGDAGGGGRGVGAGGRGADLPAVPGRRAHAARRPGRARRRSPGCRCATTAARSCAPCSRASRSGCATRWT